MRLRSLLFVPGDRPERFAKAAASGADAVILDLEDSVAPVAKAAARAAVARYLSEPAAVIRFVRVNPLDSDALDADLAAVRGADGVMLPKGFTSKILATTGSLVSGTAYVWHPAPDGGAVLPQEVVLLRGTLIPRHSARLPPGMVPVS